ncbi:MAG: Fic family protein [Pyrinomonadaceae bacterium]
MESIEKAEQFKNELDSLRPLDAEAEARIMQKFRLDWNYHSNNLEGNSLTYGETKALILFGITAQGKPLKDHFEITGHNEAINWILEIVKDKTVLTEAFIRQLHTLLLKESSYKEAQTPNGKPTRRKIEVGKYKTQPNHVITVTGETFYFATPQETPAKMQELIEWFRKEKENPEVNPIILAALFHYRFIRIHPFDDGNGRVARILMNFILMQFGYPPAIIKTEDKENYYVVLRLADADELEPFIEYITENLIRSLEIMIKGAKGESIEEPDDLDKELALLERKVRSIGQKIEVTKNRELLVKISVESVAPLFVKFLESRKKFDRFYLEKGHKLSGNGFEIENPKIEKIIGILKGNIQENTNSVEIVYWHTTFNQYSLGELDFTSIIKVYFGKTDYTVQYKDRLRLIKQYPENLSEEEISEIVKSDVEQHKIYIAERIEERSK